MEISTAGPGRRAACAMLGLFRVPDVCALASRRVLAMLFSQKNKNTISPALSFFFVIMLDRFLITD